LCNAGIGIFECGMHIVIVAVVVIVIVIAVVYFVEVVG
jgi:hypothetical protein